MKNKTTAILAALVLLFGGFTGGFFLGRNTRVGTIQTTKTVYETVPGETVILMQEILVTLPPENVVATEPEETIPSRSNPATQTQPDKPKETKPKEEKVTFPVNINTASAKELDALPGVGEVLAQRIIDYRKVKGIGEKTLEKIKPYATV